MSNSIAVIEKRFLRLTPSNNASTFGPRAAQPIIRFSLANTQAMAFLKDARLNFTFNATTDGISGNFPVQTADFNIDGPTAMCGIMDQIIISSRAFGNTIEQVVNLSRLESAYYRSKYSPKMMASNQYNLSKSLGIGRYNRYSGGFQTGGDLATASTLADLRSVAQRKPLLAATSCSIPFHSGTFLQDTPLDLSAVGGLELAIYLSRPEQLFYGTATTPPTAASSYTITNVSLTVPLLYKSSAMIQATPPEQVIEFLNWTSLYAVLDSPNSSIAYRLYLTGLVAGIHNMIPSDQINSVSWNQMALKNPVIQRLTFLKDGQRSPLEKTAIVQENTTATNINAATTYCEVIQDYMATWSSTKNQTYSQVIPQNIKGIANREGVLGIGCNFSPDSSGINVSGVLGLDIQSRNYDETTGTQTAYALYSFFLSRQAFVSTPMGMKAL